MTASPHAVELATAAAEAAADKLATDVVALDVSGQLVITDVFVVASAPNDRQVRAIVDAVEDRLRELGAKPVRREGEKDGRWVLLDYAEIVVHVQHAQERQYYALERLWKDCPTIPFVDSAAPSAATQPEGTRSDGEAPASTATLSADDVDPASADPTPLRPEPADDSPVGRTPADGGPLEEDGPSAPETTGR